LKNGNKEKSEEESGKESYKESEEACKEEGRDSQITVKFGSSVTDGENLRRPISFHLL